MVAAVAGCEQRQPGARLDEREGPPANQRVAQTPVIRDAKHVVNPRAPEVGVNQQYAAPVKFAECQRQVCNGEGFSLPRHCARDHDHLDVPLELRLMQARRQPAVLLARHRIDSGRNHELLGAFLGSPQATVRRLGFNLREERRREIVTPGSSHSIRRGTCSGGACSDVPRGDHGRLARSEKSDQVTTAIVIRARGRTRSGPLQRVSNPVHAASIATRSASPSE